MVQADMGIGDSAAHEGPKIGRSLELARKKRGLSLKQVEEATKIRAAYLKELERENFDVLPAVYVQGSLKTYANFLQLDGEALVRELKRRQAPQQEPAYVEFFPDHPTIPLVVGSQEAAEDEEDAGSTLLPAGINHYLGVGAFLIAVAVVLALTLTGNRPPAVSQVREPLISQAPPEVTPVATNKRAHQPDERDKKQVTDDKGDNPQPEQGAKPPDVNNEAEVADQTAQTWQGQATSLPEQASPDLAATQSASPSAETAEPETAETASAPPATEEPAQGNAASAPAGGPANQSSEAPPPNAGGTGEPENAPSGGAKKHHSGPRKGDDFDVRINAGGDDPVQIIGNPAN